MTYDLPCLSYLALYVISMHIINSNSRSSTHWRLNLEDGKVVTDSSPLSLPAAKIDSSQQSSDDFSYDDWVFTILSTTTAYNGQWIKESDDPTCTPCRAKMLHEVEYDNRGRRKDSSVVHHQQQPFASAAELTAPVLDCGKRANFTFYDQLVGISNRYTHPNIPEPEVAMIFKKKNSGRGGKATGVDIDHLERTLFRERRENPNSVQVYNKIGNFWRIKGDTRKSIECFRKALSLSPNEPDVLLNLARVLYNLQYLDDAIFLARRSLEVQPGDRDTWVQHFTLGEILKAYGHYHEASLHFHHTLDLNPNFQPAVAHLHDMERVPDSSVHIYTLFIIFFLVLGVLFGILSSFDSTLIDDYPDLKTQRHFNRAMAMRSIKMGMNPRSLRLKKCHS